MATFRSDYVRGARSSLLLRSREGGYGNDVGGTDHNLVGRDRGAGDREKRGREVYGRREKRGRKRDSQGRGKREKKGKIAQHCAIFRNRINAKGREPKNTGREPGLKGTGSGRFKPPCPAPQSKPCDWELGSRTRTQSPTVRFGEYPFGRPKIARDIRI